MTTFFVLLMVFQTGDDRMPFSIQAYDYPFPYETGCQDKGETEAKKPNTNMVAWGCEKVPLPVKPSHS